MIASGYFCFMPGCPGNHPGKYGLCAAEHVHDFEPVRDPSTSFLVGVCKCGVTVDHNGEEL